MAELYSNEYDDAYNDYPQGALPPVNQGGRLRILFAEYDVADDLAAADVIKFFKLPAKATIVDARLVIPAATSGAVSIGWAVGADAVEAADPDGIFSSTTTNTAIDSKMLATRPGFMKKFEESVDIELLCDTITVGLDGDTIQLIVVYVLD